jgi:rhamnulokinase
LRGTIAERTGAGAIKVIAPACHDTGSAVSAVPAKGDNYVWISSGTWSIMGVNLPQPIINDQSLKFNFTNEGGVGGTFRFSRNIMGLWLVQECRRTWASSGNEFSYAQLSDMAAKAPAHLSVIDVDDPEFLKPGDMPARIKEYCQKTSQAIPSDEASMIRIILEGIALKYRWIINCLAELTDHKLDVIHIIGGGTQNKLLNQFTADSTNKYVVTGPIEATAIGNILTQAVSLGLLKNIYEAREVVRNSFETQHYQPSEPNRWDEPYQKLVELMK